MTPARPRWTTSEVERLARRLAKVFAAAQPDLDPNVYWDNIWLETRDGFMEEARYVLKHYVARPSRKRPAKTGKGKR